MSATRLGGLPVAFVPLLGQGLVELPPAAQVAIASRKTSDCWQQLQGGIRGQVKVRNDRGRLVRLSMVEACQSGWAGVLRLLPVEVWLLEYVLLDAKGRGARSRPTGCGGSVRGATFSWAHCGFALALAGRRESVLRGASGGIDRSWFGGRIDMRAGDRSWPERIPFYLSAVGLLFLHAAGVSPIGCRASFATRWWCTRCS